MLLLIDAGNTRVKWALARDGAAAGEWMASGAGSHAELAGMSSHWQRARPTRALLCNVAGADIAAQLAFRLADAGIAHDAMRWFHSQASCAGISNGYRDPAQLGSDRFASLIGARQRFASQPLLVITAGTATTVDALDAAGHFIGGMILPGLGTMARSLALNTAQLPEINEAILQRMFADNTHDAIVSGCLHAQVGAITQALQQLPDARCVLSGGAARYIAPHLPFSVEQIDNLVLRGLHTALLSETA